MCVCVAHGAPWHVPGSHLYVRLTPANPGTAKIALIVRRFNLDRFHLRTRHLLRSCACTHKRANACTHTRAIAAMVAGNSSDLIPIKRVCQTHNCCVACINMAGHMHASTSPLVERDCSDGACDVDAWGVGGRRTDDSGRLGHHLLSPVVKSLDTSLVHRDVWTTARRFAHIPQRGPTTYRQAGPRPAMSGDQHLGRRRCRRPPARSRP